MEDFLKMTRKQLQALCKKHGVPANLKNADMAARLSLLFKDDEAQAEEPSSSGGGSSENVKVEIKKKVRFHPENDVYEFVDLYMEAADKAEARRERASRRRGLRKNERTKAENGNAVEPANSESKEIFGNQVRLTRSRKSVVIVSPPLRKRAKTGGDGVIETVEKESCGDTDVVDSFAIKASKVNKFDETVVAGKNEKISGLKEVNSLDEEHTRSKAEVPRRTRAQRKFKGDDVLVIGSDDSTRPVIEHDLLAGNRGSVHDVVPLRKSCRVAMNNISHIPEYQKIGIGEVFGKKVKKKTRKEFPTVIPDSDESIALAREEEKNVNQILGNSLRSKLSTSISPTVAGLEVDSGKERQRTCESSGVELPVVKPLRRSKRKTDGYCELGLSEDESLRTASNHQNPPLNQTRKGEAENCHEAVTSNVTHDCSEVDLVEDPGLLSKMLDGEQKHHKCRKVSARLRKGDTNSAKISSGDDYLLNKTDVPESTDLNSDGLLGITETAKDGICSAQNMTPSGSDLPDGSVEACLSSSEALLEKESTICSVEEAPASNSTKPLCVSAVGESQITACENDAVWRQTLTAGPAKRGLELEELDNPSEFSNSLSYGLPPAGCTGDVSIDAEQKHAPFDDKHDHDTLLSTETRTCKDSPTEGVPGEDEAMIVLNRSATKAEDAHDIIYDGPITGEVISKEDTCRKPWSNMPMKQNAIDGENKETFSTDAEECTKERLAFLNEESILCRRSNEDNETGEQDRTAINEWQLTVYMPGPEVVKKLYGDIKIDGMASASENHSPENKQDHHLCVQNTYGVEGKPDGNWEQILEFGRSMPEHGLTCTELYSETRNTERVSCDQTVCQVDGQPNICEHLDDEEVKIVQFREPLKVQHHIEEEDEDSIVGIITRMDDSTSEVVILSTEAGRAGSQKGSLSPVAAINEHATNHQATEPSQELDKETNDSVLCFSMVNKISGDEGVKLPSATKNEFAQDGHGAYTDEVCTTLHVTNSEVDHSRNAASDDGDLVGSDSSLSFHESQVERDSEFADVVDYSSLAYSPLSVETFTVDSCTQDPNATVYLNGVSQDISKEFAPEYMQMKRLSLYHETSQPDKVIASSSEKGPCPDDHLVGHAIVSGEKATDESNINEYSIAKSEMELESSIGSQVMLSITEVTNEVEDDNTIPQVTDRQTYDNRGYLDVVDELSLNFVNRRDAELLLMCANSEAFINLGCETGTEIGDPASVDQDACEDYGLKSSGDKKEIIKSSDTHGSYNDAGMPMESASGAKFPFDGLLKEIVDYFNGTNSKEEVVFEKSALGYDIKEKVRNSNAETYFEVPIKTCYGRHVQMNECKCIAGMDVEVYASPLEGHGEQINENADYDQVGDLFIKDDQVDHHEDIWEERCSNEGGLSGYENGKKSVSSPDVMQTSPNQSFISSAEKTVEFSTHQSMTAMRDGTSFKPVSPRESTTCLLSSFGINVLALEKDVHSSDEQNAIVNSDGDENKCKGSKGVQNPQILSSSNGYEMFEPSTGVIAQHISRIPHCAKNNQEPVPLATDDILELNTHSSNKFGVTATAPHHIAKVMKENRTHFPKTDSLKRPKPDSNRRRVLKNLQNN